MKKQNRSFLNGVVLAGFLAVQLAAATDEIQTVQKSVESLMCVPEKPLVGAYYYPWYRAPGLFKKKTWDHVMRFHLKEPQLPESGLYDSRDPAVIGGHIEQSVRGGIDFWAVSWWGPGQYADRVFRENILAHPDSSKLSYAILYESTGRLGRFENPRYDHWISDLDYLKKTYFDDPRYLKVNGRPVVFVYLSREYFRGRGQEALQQMREQMPEVYLVGDDVYFGESHDGNMTETYLAEWAKNFDAVTAYDVYGQSIGKFGGTQKAIDYLAGNYQQVKKTANSVGAAFIPAVAPGYNDTAVREGHPGRARYFTDVDQSKEGDVFRAMIRRAALPHMDSTCGNIIMVTSFNEWYEDTQIEATTGTSPASTTDDSESGTYYTGGETYVDYGHLYLDILKEETSGSGAVSGQTDGWVPEPGFISLFNGRDLTGWCFRNRRDGAVVESFDGKVASSDKGRYSARDGVLTVNFPEGLPRLISRMYTVAEFPNNFVLKLEFRASVNADSGVFIRHPQLQCRDYLVAGPYTELKQYKPQEWNLIEAVVKDGVARCTCNGEVLEEALTLPATGPIGLEGDRGQMEYRHIQLKALP